MISLQPFKGEILNRLQHLKILCEQNGYFDIYSVNSFLFIILSISVFKDKLKRHVENK